MSDERVVKLKTPEMEAWFETIKVFAMPIRSVVA
jgi:hypothetical protein